MLVRSPAAAYSFTSSKGANIHVCYQDKSGNIQQTFYDDTSRWYPSPNGIVGKGNLNNGIAITGWSSGDEERVYMIGEHDTIVERCWSSDQSKWYEGELTQKFIPAAHYSNLAAISFEDNGTLSIRVYYQATDNTIHEYCKDGENPWFAGFSFPAAAQGTSIACTCIPGKTNYHWLFFQKEDTTFVEYLMQNSSEWKVGIFKSQLRYDPGAYITCASYGKDDHRVFTIDRDNNLCVTEWNNGGNAWGKTKQLTMTIPFSPAAATPVVGVIPWVRVYVQINSQEIAEWGTNDGKTYSLMANPLPTKSN